MLYTWSKISCDIIANDCVHSRVSLIGCSSIICMLAIYMNSRTVNCLLLYCRYSISLSILRTMLPKSRLDHETTSRIEGLAWEVLAALLPVKARHCITYEIFLSKYIIFIYRMSIAKFVLTA